MEELKLPDAADRSVEVKFIKMHEVLAISGKSRSSIYDAIKKGEFPAPIKVGGRASAWIKSEVMQWTQDRIHASRSGDH